LFETVGNTGANEPLHKTGIGRNTGTTGIGTKIEIDVSIGQTLLLTVVPVTLTIYVPAERLVID
jgi:hypothetical protein